MFGIKNSIHISFSLPFIIKTYVQSCSVPNVHISIYYIYLAGNFSMSFILIVDILLPSGCEWFMLCKSSSAHNTNYDVSFSRAHFECHMFGLSCSWIQILKQKVGQEALSISPRQAKQFIIRSYRNTQQQGKTKCSPVSVSSSNLLIIERCPSGILLHNPRCTWAAPLSLELLIWRQT